MFFLLDFVVVEVKGKWFGSAAVPRRKNHGPPPRGWGKLKAGVLVRAQFRGRVMCRRSKSRLVVSMAMGARRSTSSVATDSIRRGDILSLFYRL